MKVYELAKEYELIKATDIIDLLKAGDPDGKYSVQTKLNEEQIEYVRSELETIEKIKQKEKEEKERLEREAREKAEEEKRVAEEMATKEKTEADYKPEDMIPCRSVFPGILIFTGDHTGMTYTFNGVGDRRNIEYQDLKAGMLQQKASLYNPDFIIEDATLIEDEHWMDIKEVYENMYDEKDIQRVMKLPTRDFEEEFVKLPVTARNTIATIIATQIENGTFEQYNKAKIVDKICGTRFDLKM